MSEITFTNVMRAALTTKRAATDARPTAVDPWSEAFRSAFQCHLDDEAVRWLAAKGCQGYVRTGARCVGVIGGVGTLCIACEAAHVVSDLDRAEAALRAKWEHDHDSLLGEGTTGT